MPELHDLPGEILVRGCLLKSNLKSFTESSMAWKILKGFKDLGISGLNPLQRRIISGVHCEYDVFAVAPKHSGKRVAMLLPMAAHVMTTRCGTSVMDRASAPSVLIVCSSTSTAISMDLAMKQLLLPAITKVAEVPNILILDSLADVKILTLFHTQVDILITTGSFLTHLMENPDLRIKKELKLRLYRLRYLMFEDLAMTDSHMSEDVIKFLRYLGLLVNTKMAYPPSPKNLQVLFCGTEWNDSTKSVQEALSGNCRKSVMILGSTFHALQFAQLPWTVEHCPDKFSNLTHLLKLCERAIREGKSLVIACSTCELAKKLSKDLASLGKIGHTLYTLESSGGGDLVGVFKPVYEDMNWVSVVCDDALHLLENQVDVSCLVHYDTGVPSDKVSSWPFNPKRFICLWKRLHSPSSKEDFGARSHLFISGNEDNLLSVIHFFNSLSFPLTPTLHNIVRRLEAEHRLKLPICPAVKWMGQCDKTNERLCSYRHKFVKEDLASVPVAPSNGELEVRLISCQTPSIYIARMLRHFVFENGERVFVKSFVDEFRAQVLELTKYYKVTTNRIIPSNIAIGDLYCVPFSSLKEFSKNFYANRYLRVKVLNLVPDTKVHFMRNFSMKYYKVYCIDAGLCTVVPSKNFFEMPQEFKEWPVNAVEIVLSNLNPPELTGEYSLCDIKAAKELTETRIWNVKILTAIGNTVWVNPMVTVEEDPITGHFDRVRNARTELVRRGHATIKQDLNVMYGLLLQLREVQPNYPAFPHEEILFVPDAKCVQKEVKSGVSTNSALQETAADIFKEFHKPGSEVSWVSIHLSKVDPNDLEIQPVSITLGPLRSPGEVYGTKLFSGDDEQILPVTLLELELSRDVEQILFDKPKDERDVYLDFFVYGGVVAVNPPGEALRWVRGLITDIKTTDECSKFTVILVDYGVHLEDLNAVNLMPLFTKYVKQLPFQAFSFSLSHIRPLNNGKWDSESSDAFSNIMDTFDHFQNIVKLVAFESKKSQHGWCHYKALAFVPDHEGLVLYEGEEVGLQFVKMGFAKTTPDWMELVSLVKIGVQIPTKDKWDKKEFTFGPPDEDDSESDHLEDWGTLGVLEELTEPNEEEEEETDEQEELSESNEENEEGEEKADEQGELQGHNEEQEVHERVGEKKLPEPHDDESSDDELEKNSLFDIVTEMKEKVFRYFLKGHGSESVAEAEVVKASTEVTNFSASGNEVVGTTEELDDDDDDNCVFYDCFETLPD